jgi:hypothetical protein
MMYVCAYSDGSSGKFPRSACLLAHVTLKVADVFPRSD